MSAKNLSSRVRFNSTKLVMEAVHWFLKASRQDVGMLSDLFRGDLLTSSAEELECLGVVGKVEMALTGVRNGSEKGRSPISPSRVRQPRFHFLGLGGDSSRSALLDLRLRLGGVLSSA